MIRFLGFGILCGATAALIALMAGTGVLVALAAYSLTGSLVLVAMAAYGPIGG